MITKEHAWHTQDYLAVKGNQTNMRGMQGAWGVTGCGRAPGILRKQRSIDVDEVSLPMVSLPITYDSLVYSRTPRRRMLMVK